MNGIICMNSVYECEGRKFEVHSYHGPCPLENDEPMNEIPDKFWDFYDKFSSLPKEEQEKYRIVKGGCYKF